MAEPLAPGAGEDGGAASGALPGAPVVEPRPRKRIHSPQDLELFTQSKLCEQLLSFAGELSEAVKGVPRSQERLGSASPLVRGLVRLLDELERWVEDFPPLAQPMRFGNKAFRQWHARLVERGEGLLLEALQGTAATGAEALASELARYLEAAFGDERRIDYGTGHEAAFLALLFALGARGVLAKADAADAVLLVFAAYLRVMRRLQEAYVLEPAGSHGVWGLDDFHALPFLFGAAQLVGMEEAVPTGDVYREAIVSAYAERYLYVDAVRQVLRAKRGAPFHETSPLLYDITAVPTWQKTHSGLVKMYRAEVLGKFPVIQHFLFGPTIRWPGDTDDAGMRGGALATGRDGAPG
mmetsp:Transcript_112945/g.364612  ORF Transcript_112945/g.364612 Transcript_112945/m.364612 type:complete len:353 (-) Transcript_112945:285-1343(-)